MQRLVRLALRTFIIAALIACTPGTGDEAAQDTPASQGAGGDAPPSLRCAPEGVEREPVQHFVGLTENAANERAGADGYRVRIVGRDGECFAVSLDAQPDRLNVQIWQGTVTDASLG